MASGGATSTYRPIDLYRWGRLYEPQRSVTDLERCTFYHTMDLANGETVYGNWDLRAGVDNYLGGIDYTDARALDLGAASGFLTWEMERRGASVVSVDRAPSAPYEVVPYAGYDYLTTWYRHEQTGAELQAQQTPDPTDKAQRTRHETEDQHRTQAIADARDDDPLAAGEGKRRTFDAMRSLAASLLDDPSHPGWPKLMNGYWYAHGANESAARVHYGTIYDLPADLGRFDVAMFGAVLLHLRDPIKALVSAARLVDRSLVITDVMHPPFRSISDARLRFLPDPSTPSRGASATWWRLSPGFLTAVLAMLGFEESSVSYHDQSARGTTMHMFTVVAHRTIEAEGT